MREQKDFGLLILRGAGLLLAGTFGVQKIGWYWSAFHAGKSLSSAGLAPLIAKMGLPIPFALALWITFNESIGAFLIWIRRSDATMVARGIERDELSSEEETDYATTE
jgi:hypothetical protein